MRGRHLRGEFVPLRQALKVCAKALWGLFTRVIMLGGILVGVFTANERASIAALRDFIVTFCRPRSWRWIELPKRVRRIVKTVTRVVVLIGFAARFGYRMTLTILLLLVKTRGVDAVQFGMIMVLSTWASAGSSPRWLRCCSWACSWS